MLLRVSYWLLSRSGESKGRPDHSGKEREDKMKLGNIWTGTNREGKDRKAINMNKGSQGKGRQGTQN